MNTPAIQTVILCNKNHVDIGFTESEAKMLHDACRWLMPVAAQQARHMRETEDRARLVWTVPSFLAEYALEILDGQTLKDVEAGFATGDLAWQAMPFTTHTELMDQPLLDAALAVARCLDARFGKKTICAKLTDVPGHTIGLVGALARAGVEFLHVGVNWMSSMPDVPPLFRWKDETGNELITAYSPVYGGPVHLPGDDRLLQWDVVGDNMEIPSEADLRARFAELQAEYPDAQIRAGRAEDWAGTDLRVRAAGLPIIREEIGDTWIFGSGSDPWKTARFRELLRLRREWLAAHRMLPNSRTVVAMDRQLLLIAEHTWGLGVSPASYHDRTHWSNADFARVRHRGCWRGLEASWQEQRDHLESALDALDDPQLRAEAQSAFDACKPAESDRAGWDAVDPTSTIRLGNAQLKLSETGAIRSLLVAGRERVAARGVLALFRYQTFDDADCQRWCREYGKVLEPWGVEEFAKCGLPGSAAVSRFWEPTITGCWRSEDRMEVDLAFPELAVIEAGAPQRATLAYHLSPDRLDCRLCWWNKYPTRLPEALWWSFQPAVADDDAWRLDKSGQWINPLAVVRRGGRWLHGVQSGARNGSVRLFSRDAHLLAIGQPMLYEFPDRQPDPAGGVHLNLNNNLWGTNFPQWCGDDLSFRAALQWNADQ